MLHRELLRRAGRWAELLTVDSTDEEAHLGVAQTLLAVGDRSGALRQLDILEQVLRDELGIGPSPEVYDLRIQALDTPVNAPRPPHPPAPRHAGLARQMVHFCRTSDGVRLAYATSGAGPPLVKASNWMTHLDYDWASPVWSHWSFGSMGLSGALACAMLRAAAGRQSACAGCTTLSTWVTTCWSTHC
jgi:hypothetical protein